MVSVFIVLPTKCELVRYIACLADNQNPRSFEPICIVGVVGSRGSSSKFIFRINNHSPCHFRLETTTIM
jgi:hypothetical protein